MQKKILERNPTEIGSFKGEGEHEKSKLYHYGCLFAVN